MKLLNAVCLLALAAACRSTFPVGEAVGEPIEERKVLTLAVVDSSPADYFEQTLLVEATAVAVCQNAGCWLQVEDDGHSARVRWESGCGGKYKFPSDIAGKRVLIQGSFYPKTLSAEDAEHLQSEAPAGVVIQREGYEFNASAILIPDAN